jgi:hypothetical protein
MYQFPSTSNFSHNAEFPESFKQKKCEQYDISISNLIKDWVLHPAKFRVDNNGVYSISSLEPQFKYITMMDCVLYGREDTTHCFLPWVPLIHIVIEGFSFNWSKLLSDSITSRITEYWTQMADGKVTSFFMVAYIMDAICFMMPFPLMIWS